MWQESQGRVTALAEIHRQNVCAALQMQIQTAPRDLSPYKVCPVSPFSFQVYFGQLVNSLPAYPPPNQVDTCLP